MFNFNKQPDPMALLAELIKDDTGRKQLLGFTPPSLPTPGQVQKDVDAVKTYARSQDYQIWAKDAWHQVISHISNLVRSDVETGGGMRRPLTQEEINFERGALASALNLLAISYRADMSQQSLDRMKQQANPRGPLPR